MRGEVLSLGRNWVVRERIGDGGFAKVWAVTAGDDVGAAKLIPKQPGAERELLFVDVEARNVVPVIDRGEHGDHWVIVMPLADRSLRQLIKASEGPLPLEITLAVLRDVAAALIDLDGQVVHRDLKPENVLELGGVWQIADFGISRYTEASTSPETRKHSLTPEYAAPEQWRLERATAATDIYAFGVMAYELLAGARPFPGPSQEDFHDQHLHSTPAPIPGLAATLDALVTECLYKPALTRPRAANVAARLATAAERAGESSGLELLGNVNREHALEKGAAAARASAAQSVAEQRQEIHVTAAGAWDRIVSEFRGTLERHASAAEITSSRGPLGGFACVLGYATLRVTRASQVGSSEGLPFVVTSCASIALSTSNPHATYEGRSHSFWFCDAQGRDDFAWFETSFMTHPLMNHRRAQEPFALDPDANAALALGPGMADVQVAWPFTRLTLGDLHEFIDRWGRWFAECASGRLAHPTQLPERDPAGSWHQS